MTDRRGRLWEAYENIGRSIYWRTDPDIRAVIVDVVISRYGWPSYIVQWPDAAPDWWADELATEHPSMVIE